MRNDEWVAKQAAPEGKIWVCGACGKTASNRAFGGQGWDESCFLKAILCDERSLVRNEYGRVTNAKAVSDDE